MTDTEKRNIALQKVLSLLGTIPTITILESDVQGILLPAYVYPKCHKRYMPPALSLKRYESTPEDLIAWQKQALAAAGISDRAFLHLGAYNMRFWIDVCGIHDNLARLITTVSESLSLLTPDKTTLLYFFPEEYEYLAFVEKLRFDLPEPVRSNVLVQREQRLPYNATTTVCSIVLREEQYREGLAPLQITHIREGRIGTEETLIGLYKFLIGKFDANTDYEWLTLEGNHSASNYFYEAVAPDGSLVMEALFGSKPIVLGWGDFSRREPRSEGEQFRLLIKSLTAAGWTYTGMYGEKWWMQIFAKR